MADVDGSWECVVKSPMGDQKTTTTIKSDGAAFTGTASGAMGSVDISGTVDGNNLAWKQSITVPMPMTLGLHRDRRRRHADGPGRRRRVRELPDDGYARRVIRSTP